MLSSGRAHRPDRARARHRRSPSRASRRHPRPARPGARRRGGRRPAGLAVRIEKEIPVAAGLGGGSSDAAAALVLANETLDRPVSAARLHGLAAELGADVPFFLTEGAQLGEGDGTTLTDLDLPRGLHRRPAASRRRDEGLDRLRLRRVRRAGRCGRVRPAPRPPAPGAGRAATSRGFRRTTSPPRRWPRYSARSGPFRADVSGAGPAVYGLFEDGAAAERAAREIEGRGRVWIVSPAW